MLVRRSIRNAQIEKCISVVRLSRQRLLECPYGFGVFSGAEVCSAEVVINCLVFGNELNRIQVSFDRMSKVAEVVVSVALRFVASA